MAHDEPDLTSRAAIGRRMVLTRKALGHNLPMMARLIGSASHGQIWENYESGRRRISIDQALELSRTCGVPLDWIYRGYMDSHLPRALRAAIEKLLQPQ